MTLMSNQSKQVSRRQSFNESEDLESQRLKKREEVKRIVESDEEDDIEQQRRVGMNNAAFRKSRKKDEIGDTMEQDRAKPKNRNVKSSERRFELEEEDTDPQSRKKKGGSPSR